MKKVQIDYELFRKLIFYHLGSDDQYEEDIRNELEEKLDALMEMQSKGEYVPEKTDKIVECATMLGYMSPFLCVSTWISGIENTQIYKWGIIILVHILGIGIPLLVKKKK